MTRLRADALIVLCAALWGFAFLLQKSAMAHLGPMTFIAARAGVAALVLLPLAMIEHGRSTSRLTYADLAFVLPGAGAFLTAALFQQFGIKTASVTNTGFLTALYVIATPFLSFALTGRSIAPTVWLAAALSFAGTWLLGAGTVGGFGHGDWLIAISALFWALHIVVLGLAAPRRPVLFTALQFGAVAVVALAGALLWETINLAELEAAAPQILYVGTISTALTFTLFTVALRATSPAEAAIVASSDTLFAAFFAWLLLGERLTPLGTAGAMAILAGVVIVNRAARPGTGTTGSARAGSA
jgi:drug/metabolite transporter (DMT)-like permease